MATDKHQKAWTELHRFETKARRLAVISRLKNLPIMLCYIFNALLISLYLAHRLTGLETSLLTGLPVIGSFIPFFDAVSEGGIIKLLICCALFIGIVPMVFGGLLHALLACFIHEKHRAVPKLTGTEAQQIQTIRDKCDRIEREIKFSDPSGNMPFYGAAAVIIGYVVYLVMAIPAGCADHWLGGLLGGVALCVGVFFLCFPPVIAMTFHTDNPTKKEYEDMEPEPEPKPEPKPEPTKPVRRSPAPSEEVVTTFQKPKEEPKEEPVKLPQRLDPIQWDQAFVRENQEDCRDTAMNYVKAAKQFLTEGRYENAASAMNGACLGLLCLSTLSDTYLPYLYANLYAGCRILAFSLEDRETAQFYLEQAVQQAGKCAVSEHPEVDTAKALRDLQVMKGVLKEFRSGTSLSDLRESYGSEFPQDIIDG